MGNILKNTKAISFKVASNMVYLELLIKNKADLFSFTNTSVQNDP